MFIINNLRRVARLLSKSSSVVLLVSLLGVSFSVFAQPLTIEDIVKQPAVTSPIISPNGKYFAATVPRNGKLNLFVMELESRSASVLTNFKNYDVINVQWVGNDRMLFSLGQSNSPTGVGKFDGGGLFMISRDGKESRKLSSTVRDQRDQNQYVYRGLDALQTIPDNEDEIFAEGNLRNADAEDVYKLNIKTGKSSLITVDRPARTFNWMLDRKQVPRIVLSNIKDTFTTIVHYRKDADSKWEELTRFDGDKGTAFVPLAFEDDNQTMQVATNQGRNTMAIYRYDPNTKKLGELIAQHPRYDVGADSSGASVPGVIIGGKERKILGYAVAAEKPQIVWVDETYAKLQRTVDAALPTTFNSFRRTPDGKNLIITSYSDVQPTVWYLLNEEKRTMEELFANRPWIKPEQLAEMRPFLLKTRDGLEIPSYYFLPRGYKQGDKLPTILHIHGGPSVRADTWGRFSFGVMEAQIFTSRGYAVIVPNFRITPGLGSKNYYAGFGTVGRQMSEDHEDAVKWGIEQGFVDPSKVCISGASYGGYAALMAMAKTPEMFKCAVSGLMVSDFKLQLTSRNGDTSSSEAAVNFWKKLLGSEDLSSPVVRAISPVFLADKIKGPVFVYAGEDDIRTPIEQTRDMIAALTKAGNPPKDVVIKAEEGHGFGKVENNVDLYNRMLKFLAEHLGTPGK
jgi:dipeptidyl aminopeptidase/acylaminoacyl peptidase